MPALHEILKIPEPDEQRETYGRAFEEAVYTLLQTCTERRCDLGAAIETFRRIYGEHEHVYKKLYDLLPWANNVVEVERAPTVVYAFTEPIYVTADFIVTYRNGRKEIIELKSHVLKEDEYLIASEWRFAARVMRLAYKRAGYDYPVRLIYFEKDGVQHEVIDKIDEKVVLGALARKIYGVR